MSETKKIELGEVYGYHLDGRRVPRAIIEDALRRHETGDVVKVQKGHRVSHHRYGTVELVVATQPGGGTFVMPFNAFREYIAFSPAVSIASRQTSQAEATPAPQTKMDLGWFVEYRLPKDGVPEHLVKDAIQRHEQSQWKEGQDVVSHHIYGDGTALTLVTQAQPRVTLLMTCAVYDNDFKREPLRFSDHDVQLLQDHLVSQPRRESEEHTRDL